MFFKVDSFSYNYNNGFIGPIVPLNAFSSSAPSRNVFLSKRGGW